MYLKAFFSTSVIKNMSFIPNNTNIPFHIVWKETFIVQSSQFVKVFERTQDSQIQHKAFQKSKMGSYFDIY